MTAKKSQSTLSEPLIARSLQKQKYKNPVNIISPT